MPSEVLATSSISDEEKRRHEELFKRNHVLGPIDVNRTFALSLNSPKMTSAVNTPRSTSHNNSIDSSFNSDAQLTPITHEDVENNPQTPYLRSVYREKIASANDSFSPAIPTTTKKLINFNTPNGNNKSLTGSKTSLSRASVLNRSRALDPGSSSSDLAEIAAETPSQVHVRGPSSILKKTRNNNYDRETSRQLLQKRPMLSAAVNEDGEINPLKAGKVVFSPKKDIITWNEFKGTRHSSPLTDFIDGKTDHGVKSPYIRSSSKTKASEKKSVDDEWVDDETQKEKKEKKSKKAKKEPEISNLKTVLNSLIDPQLPYILSLYLQLLFNVVIVSILLYFVYTFISTVRADVENKVDSYATDILQEIALCSREYARNNCQPGRRVVALEAACSEWEKCMNRDPATVGRAKIGAETFAEIINGFIKPISWKSMFFLLLITVGSLVLTNAAFGTYRNYSGNPNQQGGYHQQPQSQQQQIPQTPGLPHTPYQSPYKSLQMNPQFTRYYTPRPLSPTSGALTRRSRSSKKSKK